MNLTAQTVNKPSPLIIPTLASPPAKKRARGRKTPKKAKRTRFWIIMSDDHETRFGANYKMKRFKTERAAKNVARIMTTRHKTVFYVLKVVNGYKPEAGTVATKI